jgi:hypothetical protein
VIDWIYGKSNCSLMTGKFCGFISLAPDFSFKYLAAIASSPSGGREKYVNAEEKTLDHFAGCSGAAAGADFERLPAAG